MHICNTLPNPQGLGFLAVWFPQYHHSPVTVILKQVQFAASQCGGAQGGQDTGNYSMCRNLLTPEEWDEEMNPRGVSTGHSYAQMCCSAALTSPNSSHSSCWGQSLPQTLTFPPRAWDGHIKIPFLERGSGAEHQRTPLSSMSRGRWPSSYKITLYHYLKGVVVRWVWSLLPTNEQWDKRKCNLPQVWIRY